MSRTRLAAQLRKPLTKLLPQSKETNNQRGTLSEGISRCLELFLLRLLQVSMVLRMQQTDGWRIFFSL